MRTFAILFAVLAAVCSASTDVSGRKLSESNIHDREYYEKKFFDWMHEFEHEFEKASEYIHRLNIFATNDDYITKHNALPDLERGGIMLAHNEFSHYSSEEFKSHFTGAKVSEEYLKRRMNANVTTLRSSMTDVPDEIDWVEKGAVTHVKNQGQCGSCWAFSTTGSIEGAAFIHNKKLPDLSEQELVDCDHNGDMGCGGGLMDHAFEWIENHGGICSEDEYAYQASEGECKKCKPAVKVTKFTDVPTSDEEELKKAVAKQPVSVAIEADQLSFQFYHSGVYKKRCGTNLDHGVLVVGYGEEDGEKFWKVKNSWGESWGENGYIKLARDIGVPEGQCGIAMVPSYPEAEVVTEDEPADEKIEPEFNNLKSRSYYEEKFVEWMNKFEMKFERASEFVHRLNIFADNDDFIEQHNSKAKDQRGGITLGHNEFSHYTPEEFKSYYTGLKVPENYINEKRNANATALRSSMTNVPDEIDWVEKGAVTHVKNQGQCGSCWAFSTTGSVEGAAFIHNKKLPELSEQELVDCDHNGDMGCGGGLMDHAFEWIEEHGGICSEDEYAYHASAGECKKCKPVVKITKFADVPSSDEEELKKAVAKQPVSVAIEADQRSFQFYQSGVFSDSCGTNLDHGVLVVGYGEEDGEKFWKVKNSWGPSWGDKGYIKLARNIGRAEGQCGIAMVPSYPEATVIDEEVPVKETVEESIEEPVISAYGSSASIEQCGDPKTAAVSFSALDISPKSPARGEPINFKAKGTIQKAFTSAVFEMKVELGGMKVYSHKGSMCGTTKVPLPLSLGDIEIHGFNCPAKQGSLDDVNLDVTLPDIAPAGNYQVSLVSKDGDNNVFCLNMKMKLSGDGMKKQTLVYQAIE